MAKFRELQNGDTFDWIKPDSMFNTFYKRCTKVSTRMYRDEDGLDYLVGSVNAQVYHVEKRTD